MKVAGCGSIDAVWRRTLFTKALLLGAWLAPLALAPRAVMAEALPPLLAEAFAAEERATHKRMELNHVRGNVKTQYVVERVLPDRAHIVHTSVTGVRTETVIVRDRVFLKSGGKWQSSPLPVQAPRGSLPSMATLMAQGASNIVEQQPQRREGRLTRIFTAELKWTAGQGSNQGRMEIAVDEAARLPTSLSFTGSCGALACAFTQSMSYDRGITIPVPQ
jgi:hypothetical protein